MVTRVSQKKFEHFLGDTRDPKCSGRSAAKWARPLFSKFMYKLVSFMWAKGLQSGQSQLKAM